MSSSYEKSNSSESFLFIIGLGAAIVFLGIKYNFEYVILLWKYIRLAFLYPFTWIPDWLPFYGKLEIDRAFNYILETPFTDIMPITAKRIDLHYLTWLSWVPGSIMFYWGFKRLLSSGKLSHRYNMEELLVKFGTIYGDLAPYLNDDPLTKPLIFKRAQKSTHQWAMSISPRDFSLMNPPLGLEKKSTKNKLLNAPIWDGDKSFDHDLAERAFNAQLGKSFTGIQHLSKNERIVFEKLTSFLSISLEDRVSHFKSIALPLLKAKNVKATSTSSLSSGMLKLKKLIEEDIAKEKELAVAKKLKFNPKKYMQVNRIEKFVTDSALEKLFKLIKSESVMTSHAFTRCGMMRLLEVSRESGVVASEQFRWLKKIDRTLWFGLSTMGRKVSFVESAGPLAHLLLEIDIGRPISHPVTSEAVNGLYIALECDAE
ncbi:hypothetical protein [Psychromonas sp. SP041]|uniref:secretion/conjugation apparatus DotM-related subunit n=1 Tax=Psychromonas sp. SP041 TaxID=1365007 RepID=UPI0010C77457|nr:hypothetical protein [Psychromonas sp. SP041]